MKVFLSASRSNNKYVNAELAQKIIQKKGHDVYPLFDVNTSKDFYTINNYIDDCDVIVILYDGTISDANVAYTCGYAYAKDKYIIIVNMDNNSDDMITYSNDKVLRGLADLLDFDFNCCPGATAYC